MITIRYWELALIFLAGIGFWHLAMGVVYPWYGAKMDLKIAREKAKAAHYNAMCASQPPPIGSIPPVDEPTVHIGQLMPVPRQRDPEPELPIELRPSRPVDHAEVPIFAGIAMNLSWIPDSFAAFHFGAQSWSVQTGAYPVVPTPARELEEAIA